MTERELLAPVLDRADIIIDTSLMDLHQHRERLLKEFFNQNDDGGISILISSFGYKYGVPQDSSFIMDVRCLPNPYYVDELKNLTGQDEPVKYIENRRLDIWVHNKTIQKAIESYRIEKSQKEYLKSHKIKNMGTPNKPVKTTHKCLELTKNFLDFFIPQFLNNVRSQLHISVGCTGGRHRSVAMAEWLGEIYSKNYSGVCVIHRDKGHGHQ